MANEARREPRIRVMLRGRLRAKGPEHDACLLDVSSRGLLLSSEAAPPRGTFIEVLVHGHSLVGVVEWAEERRFGVVLRERIDAAALIAGSASDISLRGRGTVQAATYRATKPWWGSGDSLARVAQFGLIGVAGLGAALLVANTVGQGMAPLQQARLAMVGSR